MMSLCWITSYPKSGNTWLRFFLYAYFHGEINSSSSVEKFIPGIHAMSGPGELYNKKLSYVKSHFMYTDEFSSLVPGSKAIYILRNPKSVLLSNLNYFKIRSDNPVSDRTFVEQFIDNKGARLWITQGMGSWPEHAESWLSQKKIPTLAIKYEDLKESPEKIFSRIISYLGKEVDVKKVKQAINLSSFARMRTLEEKEKEKEIYNNVFSGTNDSTDKGLWFMRSGNTSESLEHIDPDLDTRFDEVFAPYVKKINELHSGSL